MLNRRGFLKNTLLTATAIAVLPDTNLLATDRETIQNKPKLKLRFVLASDGHYGQKGTEYKQSFTNIVNWVNQEHTRQSLNFCIFNGDIVHDQPNLLPETKQYFDRLKMPYYTVPGNHDWATTEVWKKVWGYEDNYVFEVKEYGFILGNTSDEKGEYLCPNVSWLRIMLEKFKSKKHVFVILHIPSHKWEDVGLECPEVDNLFAQYPNITAVFHGHHHEQDGVKYSNNKKIPHFFDAHFGGNWGTEYKGYRVVEIDEKDQVSTFQYNASQTPILNATSLKTR